MTHESAVLIGFVGLGLGAIGVVGLIALMVHWARWSRRPDVERALPHEGDWRDDVPAYFFPRMERRERVVSKVCDLEEVA